MARRRTGSAFGDRRSGRYFAQVPVGKASRRTVACPHAKSIEEARARAGLAAELAESLAIAGKEAFVDVTVEHVCSIEGGLVDDVRALVRALCDGGAAVQSMKGGA
jgi:hypothetical protein